MCLCAALGWIGDLSGLHAASHPIPGPKPPWKIIATYTCLRISRCRQWIDLSQIFVKT